MNLRNFLSRKDETVKFSHYRIHLVGPVVLLLILNTIGVFVYAEEQVIRIEAKKFEYIPSEIALKKGVPVVLEFTSLDRLHGFNCPELGVRADIHPNKVARVRVVPQKAGTFVFFCDNFCGSGHGEMRGKIIVGE